MRTNSREHVLPPSLLVLVRQPGEVDSRCFFAHPRYVLTAVTTACSSARGVSECVTAAFAPESVLREPLIPGGGQDCRLTIFHDNILRHNAGAVPLPARMDVSSMSIATERVEEDRTRG